MIFQQKIKPDSTIYDTLKFMSHKTGQYYYNYQLDSNALDVKIVAKWNESDERKQQQTHSIEQTFKNKNQ